jgi:hypothetical protein
VTDSVMLNNAIFVIFSTQEFHTMVAPIKIKIIFKPFVRLNYWFIFKKIDMPILFYFSNCLK